MEHPAWDDLRVLLAVHRHRSFLGAGRALGLSTSTTARRIGALERALGRPLVRRSSDGSALEPEALPLVALAEQLEQGLAATRRDESGPRSLAGTVRLSVGEGAVRPVVSALAELRRVHPEIHVELVAEPRLADLARREADLGLRMARSSSTVLVERTLGSLRFGLWAAPEYVDRRLRGGRLRRSELGRHDFVGYEGRLRALPQERWLRERGATSFPFRSNSDAAIVEAAVRGHGIAAIAEVVARDTPGLVRLAVDDEPLPTIELYVVFHRQLRRVARVQAVARALEQAFRTRAYGVSVAAK
jgi:DNA-binding transcriptional LysR family regulator